ncbi:MAG: type II toxin-antitoxin system VapB family antitoxin [Thermodesulfobacteriota bacterium]
MNTAKIFKSGNSLAVRLPKEFHIGGDEVFIKRVGNVLILSGKTDPWQNLVDSLGMFSDDYLAQRQQPLLEDRESF